jgi:hypothetical protein
VAKTTVSVPVPMSAVPPVPPGPPQVTVSSPAPS